MYLHLFSVCWCPFGRFVRLLSCLVASHRLYHRCLKAGYDAAICISEESSNAATVVPWGMVSLNLVLVLGINLEGSKKVCAIAIAGVLGWG